MSQKHRLQQRLAAERAAAPKTMNHRERRAARRNGGSATATPFKIGRGRSW